MPDDAPVNRLMEVLLVKMKFPQTSPDGQPLSYKLHHRSSGRQLLENQTLSQASVKSGDVIRILPEITAGASRRGIGEFFTGTCKAKVVNIRKPYLDSR